MAPSFWRNPQVSLVNNFKWPLELDHEPYKQFMAIPGCCYPGTMALLNHLVKDTLDVGEIYLELGTYCGRTMVAALEGNNAKAVSIDPFIHDNSRIDVYRNLEKYDVQSRVDVNHMYWEQFIKTGKTLPPVGVFFNDGDHGTGSTQTSLNAFIPFLADKSIIVVDDLAMQPVEADLILWEKEHEDHILFRHDIRSDGFFMGQAIFGYQK